VQESEDRVHDRHSEMYDVAVRYYIQNETMEAIARQLGRSRSSVSRLLAQARDTGLVRITLPEHPGTDSAPAKRIRDQFDVRVHIVPVGDATPAARLDRVARMAAAIFADSVTDDQMIGVAWGTTHRQRRQAHRSASREGHHDRAAQRGHRPGDPRRANQGGRHQLDVILRNCGLDSPGRGPQAGIRSGWRVGRLGPAAGARRVCVWSPFVFDRRARPTSFEISDSYERMRRRHRRISIRGVCGVAMVKVLNRQCAARRGRARPWPRLPIAGPAPCAPNIATTGKDRP